MILTLHRYPIPSAVSVLSYCISSNFVSALKETEALESLSNLVKV